MEPDFKSHPILSYVMSRKALSESLIGGSELPVNASDTVLSIDIEADKKEGDEELIVNQMPNLKRPEVLAAMTAAITDVVQARAVIQGLGECPDHEAVDLARSKIAEIESNLSKQLEDIVSAPRSESVDRLEWRVLQAEKEEQARQAAEREKFPFKAVIQLYEMHEAYEDSLKEAEQRLVKIYESVDNCSEVLPVKDEVNEEVVIVLKEASQKNLEKVELRGQMLRFLPEDFGKLSTLILLDLSNNQLEVLPDSIAGLTNLQQLYLSSNLLVSLPDSIGFLKSLRVLNVSGNKLKALPDSISRCSALIELDASFNQLTYLPTGIGHELVNLQKLFIHLNKIRSLPSSLCEIQSLRYLDVHFNELKSLPLGIGNLTNLEILNASSNFSDLVSIPDTVGDLINLIELDLSNNQIRELPCSFGRLQKLEKLNLDQNPLVFPPMDIVEQGVEAVKEYMAKKWLEFLLEEEKRSLSEASDMHSQDNWLHRGGSWFGGWFSAVTGSLTGFLGTTNKSHNDDYLEEQL